VLLELGWSSTSLKARRARLQLWWRLGQSDSLLMRSLETQALVGLPQPVQSVSTYNWFRGTATEVAWLANRSGLSSDALRALPRSEFKRILSEELWQEEWTSRVALMRNSSRLRPFAVALVAAQQQDPCEHARRVRWQAAPYLSAVGGLSQAWLLAQCRLGLLGTEEERGRWAGIPRAQRSCVHCGASSCGVYHLLSKCQRLRDDVGVFPVGPFEVSDAWTTLMSCDTQTPAHIWRSLARVVSLLWRAKERRLAVQARSAPEPPVVVDEDWAESDESSSA